MGLGEFRIKAQECYAWAQRARSPDQWAARVKMAQLWLGLAQKAEARAAAVTPPDVVVADPVLSSETAGSEPASVPPGPADPDRSSDSKECSRTPKLTAASPLG